MKDETLIVFILDASGSMKPLTRDVVGSVKTFIQDQKEIGNNFQVITYQFNTAVRRVDIEDYKTLGSTALLDAMCQVTDEIGQDLLNRLEQDRPNKVIIVTMTDGQENASVNHTVEDVKDRVKHQTEKYGWQYVFLGANIDSFSTGTTLGVSGALTANYESTSKGTRKAIKSLSESVLAYRSGSDFKI